MHPPLASTLHLSFVDCTFCIRYSPCVSNPSVKPADIFSSYYGASDVPFTVFCSVWVSQAAYNGLLLTKLVEGKPIIIASFCFCYAQTIDHIHCFCCCSFWYMLQVLHPAVLTAVYTASMMEQRLVRVGHKSQLGVCYCSLSWEVMD